ncbi:MAG: RHS repeat-associated core domain-containing protein, partial [Bryobacteraceae bacterium]
FPVQTDRLGSVRSGGPGNLGYQAQYPYGVEYTVTANDREKYATYTRDSATGLDYAMNRYYSSQWGRFLSPDPNQESASPTNPGTLNLYGYTIGDPVNLFDRTGADPVDPGSPGNEPPFACDLFGGCNGCPDDLWDGGYGFMPSPGPYGPLCVFLPLDPVPEPEPAPPQISLKEVGDCVYPNGTSISIGVWTLEVEYQVLADGVPLVGQVALSGLTISELVVTTSGPNISGNGVWCAFSGSCGTAGSLRSSGVFWDVLASPSGASKPSAANQTFMANGAPIPVLTYGGAVTFKNVYNSPNKRISVGNGALTANSGTRTCGQTGDPGPDHVSAPIHME